MSSNTPLFPGQNANDFVHPEKGVGKYSNRSLRTTTQLLQDMPLEHHEPGEGRHPHNVTLSRWFRGLDPAGDPMDGAGQGERLENFRFRPKTFRGIQGAIDGDYGHRNRETSTSLYSNWVYDGIVPEPLESGGHGVRGVDAEGTANTFGRFNPHDHQVRAATVNTTHGGQEKPEEDHPYGHNRVREWKGITSAL